MAEYHRQLRLNKWPGNYCLTMKNPFFVIRIIFTRDCFRHNSVLVGELFQNRPEPPENSHQTNQRKAQNNLAQTPIACFHRTHYVGNFA